MIVFTDNMVSARRYFPNLREAIPAPDPSLSDILRELMGDAVPQAAVVDDFPETFPNALVVEKASRSQYDLIIKALGGNPALPHGLILLAGEGQGFHGQRDRSWTALDGNIHLVVHLAPRVPIYERPLGLTILAAVSALQAIDTLPGLAGRAATKWVNDITIDGEKVCGVLTYAQAEDNGVTGAVLGIGLNVETKPDVESSRFITRATSLREKSGSPDKITIAATIRPMLQALADNYRHFLAGGYFSLLDIYRRRSAVVGRWVEIHPDSPHDPDEIIKGKVNAIGDNLELCLENRPQPVTRGRLALRE